MEQSHVGVKVTLTTKSTLDAVNMYCCDMHVNKMNLSANHINTPYVTKYNTFELVHKS